MSTIDKLLCVAMLFLALLPVPYASAQPAPTERRLALVIGNGEYAAAPALPTAANDAGLVAQTLQAAGFDVMGARDLDGDALRHTFRDFVAKAAEAGPEGVVVVYIAGHGVQLEGENFFVPVDARIERDVDVPVQALRLSDYLRPLAAARPKATIVVVDAAYENTLGQAGQPLAGGLALIEPPPGTIIAFNAAPSTVAPPAAPPYGAYAQALAEMIREGGLQPNVLFDRVRLRVNDVTSGASLPWHAGRIDAPFVFLERAPDAPAVVASHQTLAARRAQPIRSFDVREAYLAALERDTLQGYIEFVEAFPDDPLARRVRAIIAARREAITWRRTREADTPEAYWSYLDRYPKGPHAWDARRRLAYLTAPLEPPPTYTAFHYVDVPPPPRDEIVFVERRVVLFADPVWRFAPPPPPPLLFLPPPPPPLFFPPPPPPVALFVLPTPAFVPVPVYVRPPVYVAPPPNNPVFVNIHNTTVINNTVVNNPPATGSNPAQPRSAAPLAATPAVALPPAVAARTPRTPDAARTGAAAPGAPGALPSASGGLAGARGSSPAPGATTAQPQAPAAGKLLPGDPKGTTALPERAPASANVPGSAGKDGRPARGTAPPATASTKEPGAGAAPAKDATTRSTKAGVSTDGGTSRDGTRPRDRGPDQGKERTADRPKTQAGQPPGKDQPDARPKAATTTAGAARDTKGTFLKDAPHVKAAGKSGAEAAKDAAREKRQQDRAARGETRRAEERTLDQRRAERLGELKRQPPPAVAPRPEAARAAPPRGPDRAPPPPAAARPQPPPRAPAASAPAPQQRNVKDQKKCGGPNLPPCR